MNKIYLCGAIQNYKKANEWRQEAINKLPEFKCLNPTDRMYEDYSAEKIIQFDNADIVNADIILVNASIPSWGTAMEILFAFQLHKPIIVFIDGNIGSLSPWLTFHSTSITDSLDAAIKYIKEEKC